MLENKGIVLQVLPLAECRILVKSPADEAPGSKTGPDRAPPMLDVSLSQVVKDHALVDGNTGVARQEPVQEGAHCSPTDRGISLASQSNGDPQHLRALRNTGLAPQIRLGFPPWRLESFPAS